MLAAFDPAALLHPVEQPRDADRLDLEQFGKAGLGDPAAFLDALFLDQADHQPPLRRRQPIGRAEGLEAAAHQPPRVVDQKAQPFDAFVIHEPHIL